MTRIVLTCVALTGGAILFGCGEQSAAGAGKALTTRPAGEKTMNTAKATFAAGCFWGVQLEFDKTEGVVSTSVGYMGGKTSSPTYKQVCTDTTGHAEVVQIEYDPQRVSYETLVRTFFELHDPTQVNRQGPDVGSQYRSAIFFHTPEQEKAARAFIERLTKAGEYARPIATEVTAAGEFWPAEDYHQKYFERRGMESCHIRRKLRTIP